MPMRKVFLLIFVGFCVLFISCTPTKTSSENVGNTTTLPDNPVAIARQDTVNSMRLLSSGSLPGSSNKDSPRLEGWFDVNDYFKVLNHLNVQSGYTLEYFYREETNGGRPFLYARKIDRKPHATLSDLDKYWGLKDPYKYLDYIGIDNTEEGYFQFIALRILGGQFYIFWHSAYQNRDLICSHSGLESIIARNSELPLETQNKARQLDLAPRVELNSDTAIVRVITFATYGGFTEETYTIKREFPHNIIDIKTNKLIPFSSSTRF
jgi:hypothetical protein